MKEEQRSLYVALSAASRVCSLCSFCRYGYWENWGCQFKAEGPYCENGLNQFYEFIDPGDMYPGNDCWLFSPEKGGISVAADTAGFWMQANAVGLLD